MDEIGILDPKGINLNPLTEKEYSDSYKELGIVWSQYPAYQKSNEILNSINQSQITFIISGTGSGKTVLIPKFALHYTNYQGKIGISLPKRTITQSAASFAATTLDVTLGKEIGYIYKGSPKNMINSNNKMIYMTDGILIMKFVNDPTLSEFDVIIIDEAHERKVQIDILLLFIKRILESGKRPDLRVIIMSATIDIEKYQNYYQGISQNTIHISGQPNYPIETRFLKESSKSYLTEGLRIIDDLSQQSIKQDILFFIATSNEALQTCQKIRKQHPRIYCIEFYAEMDSSLKIYATSKNQFLELGNYDQKVIMATNVAESSITIDGLKYVIDSCYELFSYFNPYVYGNVLEKRLITKAQAYQRRGRVGRTEPGICYHLLTQAQFNLLEDYPEPDILKQDITMDILKIIQLTSNHTLNEGYELMNQLMDPPKKEYIESTQRLLILYQMINSNDTLTRLGYMVNQFSSVPINQTLFLIYAYERYCAKQASIIIAMIKELNGNVTNLFFKSDTLCQSDCQKPASKKLLNKLMQKKGDHMTFLKIFQEFKKSNDQQIWARKYGIRLNILNSVEKTANQYYYKMIRLSKNSELSRITAVDINKNILESLKLSHRHLTAKNLSPIFTNHDVKIKGSIESKSIVHNFYQNKQLSQKTFIYDELVNINNNWKFNVITII